MQAAFNTLPEFQASPVGNLFQAFRQVDNSISRGFEGTGLGLPLSKSLAESQDGTLHIDSESGRGTKVTVTLDAAVTSSLALAWTA